MRLWHQLLIPKLPYNQLIGQHRECCALRGNGWNKRHSTVQYALDDDFEKLVAYHWMIMNELTKRKPNINTDDKWLYPQYRGKVLGWDENINTDKAVTIKFNLNNKMIYDYHDDRYLAECIENLKEKGIIIEKNNINN